MQDGRFPLVVSQNQAPWHVRFLWLTGDVPGIILLFLTAATGFIAGITATLLVKRRAKPQHKNESNNK
ncbi:MAG: LapA family protein [candidate division KSB1 bacterium]|nr:LapA family protein [candidate division KSB1 bacterium]